jgi:Tol biopolymer transport system component
MNASGPRWSPDGALLAFSGRRRGVPASDDGGGSIWFLRADRLDDAPVQVRGVEGTPIFSPDNKWIAFTKRIAKPKAPQYANDADRLINERFKGKAYEWLNYRFDQRGYLPDPRDPDATPPEELFIVSRAGRGKQLTRTTVNVSGVRGGLTAAPSPSSPTSSSATSIPMRARISGP